VEYGPRSWRGVVRHARHALSPSKGAEPVANRWRPRARPRPRSAGAPGRGRQESRTTTRTRTSTILRTTTGHQDWGPCSSQRF